MWLWSLRGFQGDPPTLEYVTSTNRIWVNDLLRFRRQIEFEKVDKNWKKPKKVY